jgi:hypothetical protein
MLVQLYLAHVFTLVCHFFLVEILYYAVLFIDCNSSFYRVLSCCTQKLVSYLSLLLEMYVTAIPGTLQRNFL